MQHDNKRASSSFAYQSTSKRFGEPAKFVPVAFASCTILGLYIIYVGFHCVPMLQLGIPAAHRDAARHSRAVMQLIVFHMVTSMLVICYVRSILESPGGIPEDDPLWAYTGDGRNEQIHSNIQEVKKSGDRRHCKWCGKYKPDRCHHCRVCRTCILKMDHHCPWIYNCVGFKNYKYFYLLLLYCVIDLHLIIWTIIESVVRVTDLDTPFSTMFFVIFGATLATFMGVLLTIFFIFHTWLMLKAMTTIEFCEKKMPKSGGKESSHSESSSQTSIYDMGCFGNIKAVLGPNPLTWPLPVAPPIGDGLVYVTSETRLTKDFEGKGIRRKTHNTVQRSSHVQQHSTGASDGQWGYKR